MLMRKSLSPSVAGFYGGSHGAGYVYYAESMKWRDCKVLSFVCVCVCVCVWFIVTVQKYTFSEWLLYTTHIKNAKIATHPTNSDRTETIDTK